MINRKTFFDLLRECLLFPHLTSSQVDGIEAILNEWEAHPDQYTDLRWLAYMLATAYHETGKTMQAVEEFGRGSHRPYGSKIKRSRLPYDKPNKIYYGRGLVQLTWYENYEQMGRLLGIDLLNNPELALKLNVSIRIMFEGMTKGNSHFGDFTGKSLENYFNDKTEDWYGARRIINGEDKKMAIGDYGKLFFSSLKSAL